jgi:hypothetical protein
MALTLMERILKKNKFKRIVTPITLILKEMTNYNKMPQNLWHEEMWLGSFRSVARLVIKPLLEFNSLQPVAQLDQIRALDREQGRRGTTNERRVDIAKFLQKIKVEDPVEAPQAKKLMLDKNGRPIFEVLSLYTSKDKQLALTKEDSTTIYLAASVLTTFLSKRPGTISGQNFWAKATTSPTTPKTPRIFKSLRGNNQKSMLNNLSARTK